MHDGSLPDSDFLRLNRKIVIDAGTEVGLPFNGSPPDLGAVETNSFFLDDADFDGNGEVDGAVFLIWQRGFGSDGQVDNSLGDANLDTLVDNSDLAIWESRFGTTTPLGSLTSVPEPTTMTLFCCLTLAYAVLRKDRLLEILNFADARSKTPRRWRQIR